MRALTRLLPADAGPAPPFSVAINQAVRGCRVWRPRPVREPPRGARMTITAETLSVEIFADGADRASILELAANPRIKGFTTNPTLMRKAGITDYESFARSILPGIGGRPIS